MGNLATPESLVMRWNEVLRDPTLQDLPYKIELNAWGKVEMGPASNRHGRLQIALGAELMGQLQGMAISECSILTRIGIRVPDVIWASPAFMSAYGEITPFTKAPEICIEIVSPANVQAEIDEKIGAFLAAGAVEVWLVFENGTIRYFGPAGEKPRSDFPVSVTLPPPLLPGP
ncbi:MAG: Uma2 family endonuclease [Betaproteobacteria bacterium]